jgi:carbamoyl-phosphate synthase large subunit
MNILLSSAGRRVGLIGCLRDGLKRAGVAGDVLAVDRAFAAPAMHLSAHAWQVPACLDGAFIEVVLGLARDHGVGLIVPTIDTELSAYAEALPAFQRCGIAVAVSDSQTISICADKRLTHAWLVESGFPTVRQASSAEQVLSTPGGWRFPVITKPLGGSASNGVRRVPSLVQLRAAADERDDLIVQEIAPGDEYTVNVYVNKNGRCVCAVPHRRLEVRAGEVSKGLTVKHRAMMRLAASVAETLPGAWGPLNIQMFLDSDSALRIIEINPRFGGGYPLAHQAGAHFTEWLIEETRGEPIPEAMDDWQDDLAMLRYDDAVFLPGAMIREQAADAVLSGV